MADSGEEPGGGPLMGGGAMGAAMRAHDWSASPLGPPERWPRSLVAIANLMLGSRQPMFVAWGSELGFLYNDAYAPILGARHPAALGAPFESIWSEIWDDISPLIDRALAGEATWSENLHLVMERNGYPEDTWYTFSYSPAFGDDGRVAGMFCSCIETTEAVLAERVKVAERERLAAMFEQAPGFMVLLDGPEHRFELANRAYLTLVDNRDVVGKTIAEALPEAISQGFVDLLDQAYRSGDAFSARGVKFDVVTGADGAIAEHYVDLVYQPLVDRGGRVTGIFVQGSDVTERMKADSALRDNASRLRLVQQAGGVGSFDYDIASGRIVRSPEYLAIHGLPEQDLLQGQASEDWRDRLHPDDRARIEAAFDADLANPQPFDLEYRIRRADTGETRWIVNRGVVLADEAGRATRLISAQTDVTERKDREDALTASDRDLRIAIEAGRFGTWTLDLASGDLATSATCRKNFGRDAGDTLSYAELRDSVHPDDAERMRLAVEHSIATGEDYDIEYRIVTPAGAVRSVYIRAKPIYAGDGTPLRMSGISLDVTERHRAEEALRASEEFGRRVLDSSGDCIKVLSLDARIETMNSGGLITMQVDDFESLKGSYWLDNWKHPCRADADAAVEAARAGQIGRFQGPCETAKGTPKYWDVVVTPIVGADGKPEKLLVISRDITAERGAADLVQASETRFRTLVETVTTLVWQTDGKGQFVQRNAAWERFTGQTTAQTLGFGWVDAIHPDDRVPLDNAYRQALPTRSPYDCEYRLRRSDGEYRLMQVNGAPIVDDAGDVIEWIGANTDLTEQRRAENALRESEARFRLIADSAPVPIWVTKLDRSRGFVNQAYVDFVGQPYHEALDFDWREIIHPDDAEALRAASIAGEASMDSFTLEGRYRRADGEWRWLRSESQPRWDAAGDHTGFIGVAYDVTDSKEAELRLRESEARFRNMADHAPVMMWVTQPDGFCTYLNRSWYEFTGQSEAEAEGFGWLNATHPDDKAMAERAFFDANKDHTPFRVEYRLRRADGTYRWAIDTAAPRFGPDGEFLGFVGSVIDIGERREAEDRLRVSEGRFRAAVEAVEGVLWTNTAEGEMRGEQPGWAALTGQTFEQYQGYGWADAVHREDAQPTVDAWQIALEQRGPFLFEHRVRRADGQWRDFSIRAIPTLGTGGEILEWVGVHTDITERKRAEEKLRESEAELRLVTDALPLLVSYVDESQHYRFVNRAYEDWFGRPRAAIIGKTMGEVMGAAGLARVAPTFARALAGEQFAFDSRLPGPGGQLRDVTIELIPNTIDGRVAGVYAMTQDISERKAAQHAERAHAAEREAILQQLAEGVIITDARGHITFANDAAAALHGVEAIDTTPGAYAATFTLLSEEGTPLAYDDLPLTRAFREGEATIGMRWRLVRPDGVELIVLGSAQPVMGPAGGLMGAVLTFSDDTVRAEAEQALARLNETLEDEVLRRTAERDRLWDSSPDLLLVIDFEGFFRRVNPAWTAILGWTAEELVGTRVDRWIHPDDIAITDEAVVLASTDRFKTVENRYRHKDGGLRHISWRAAPSDELIYAFGRDVTALREQEQALANAEESLRQAQKMEAIGKLTGGIAHDFNNLLTVILSSADLLKRPDIAPEKRARYIEAIGETAQRAAALTSQLLAFARRQPLSSEAFDGAERVRALRPMLGTMLGEGVRLSVKAGAKPLVIKADPNQFENALLNMAVNARDAMPGGGRLTIALDVAADPGFIDVTVADTGQGIEADKLGTIFEPFYTTKAVGKGTGLGLSQVYGFAQQSGGRISVTSEPGRGTRFTMTLPRGERADAVPERAATPPCDMRPVSVLVVEDNRAVGEFAARLLDDMRHTVVLEDNGEAALRRVEAGERFDLVFSDVIMPGSIDGLALARTLRADHPGLPVILTTGYAQGLAEDAAHGFEILRKPYSADALAALIAKAVR